MTILATGRVGKDFRLTIPRGVREFLEPEEGEDLAFYTLGNQKGHMCFRKA